MGHKYTPVIQKRGRWYIAWAEEVPGANAQERTMAAVKRSLKEAVCGILEVNRGLARRKRRRKA